MNRVGPSLLALLLLLGLGGCGAPRGASGAAGGGSSGSTSGPSSGVTSSGPGGGGSVGDALAAVQITQLAYLRGDAGPRLLIAGTATSNEVVSVHVEFLDGQGNAASVSDGAGGMLSSLELTVAATSDGAFFRVNQSAPGFEVQVPEVRATPTDPEGNTGMSVSAMIADPAMRQDAQTCDPRGFDVCASTDVCAPASHTCTSDARFRATSCLAAPKLDPAAGTTSVSGDTTGVTLWRAPAGCVQAAVLGQPYPEGIASLHLASRAPVLTITTIDATTDFDTVIFVLPSCGDAAITPLACNDDAFGGTTASSIHLTDVAAGDYVVVVEAATSQGGHYRLSALSR